MLFFKQVHHRNFHYQSTNFSLEAKAFYFGAKNSYLDDQLAYEVNGQNLTVQKQFFLRFIAHLELR